MSRLAIYGSCVFLVFCAFAPDRLSADALVVTKAMRASTIAEIFVEPDVVRVEIEVGAADLLAFRNVLPDEFYEKVIGEEQALADRLEAFLEDDWLLLADGAPLAGQVQQVLPGKRIVRDEVTGDPLPVQPDSAEDVVHIRIGYPLENPPSSVTFQPPISDDTRFAAANIGFVVYHRGVVVNDFRYLSQAETLDLDWEDPWHSRFRNKNLRRQFDSPAAAFLYVEHFEVRKEIIIRPRDLQNWVDLGLEDLTTIAVEKQAEIKRLAAEFLASKSPVTIDGQDRKGELDRVHFISRTLRKTGVIDPPQQLDVTSATLGVIFVYPIPRLPQEVSMHWELFTPKLQAIPAATTDEAGGLPATLTPEDPVLRWRNFLADPQVPGMLAIPPPPAPPRITISMISALFAVAVMGLVIAWLCGAPQSDGKRLFIACLCCLICGVVALPFTQASIPNPLTKQSTITNEQQDEILAGLLHNIYRAFDRRDENLVYDRLAISISGDMLTDVYLQTRRSMELEGQGGARVKVDGVDLLETQSRAETESGGFIRRARWNVSGSVGHWGHTHQRTNQYQADFVIEPVEDRWKIMRMEVLGQQRIDQLPASAGRRTP